MNRMKKGIAALLLVCLMLAAVTPYASAETIIASGRCTEDILWTLNSDGLLNITGSGEMPNYTNDTRAPWFEYRDRVKEVDLSDDIPNIGSWSFADFKFLTSVTFPDRLPAYQNCVVGEYAFAGCYMLKSIWQAYTAQIGKWAFSYCGSLKDVHFFSIITEIGEGAFYYSGLESMSISAPSIGASAFDSCFQLKDVYIRSTEIGARAFCNCWNLSSLGFSDKVERIGERAFGNCYSLSYVKIPDSISFIGDGAFAGCRSLAGIWASNDNAYYTTDDNGVLYNKDKTELLMCPKMLTGEFIIPEGITRISSGAFDGCTELSSVVIPGSTQEIGDWAFSHCNFSQIAIPDSVRELGEGAFWKTPLVHVSLPNSLTTIKGRTFWECSALESVIIPSNITQIEGCPFDDCQSLKTICFLGNAPEMDEDVFNDWNLVKAATLYYLPGTSGWTTPTWNGYNTIPWDGKKIPTGNTQTQFQDIPLGAYYANAVSWAVANNVTNGTSTSTFSPEATCTRGQIVAFLWRAAGEPAPTGTVNPFTDVKEDAYYYKAVLWAVENGITSGTSKTTFSPDEGCTRGQVATFLWRYEGKPGNATRNPFTDVRTSAYYYGAVLWAVENGITNGTSATTFEPEATCTRGQIVTFLYRDIAN